MNEESELIDSKLVRALFRVVGPIIAKVMQSPLRRRLQDPVSTLISAGVVPGQQILEVGCGTGFFTIPAAQLVGESGRVHAIDLHEAALQLVAKKAQDAGVNRLALSRVNAIDCKLADESVDLVLLFGVIPSPTLPLDTLLPEMHRVLRREGGLAVWTAAPFWSPTKLTQQGLFAYVGEEHRVHRYRKTDDHKASIPSLERVGDQAALSTAA
jgi:demethylmenaquinone methyltransferase/2-methoxy-6-polyprenyl-1,4-benzoquinol methylase